ncbi:MULTISPECIES: hypothetical protein [Microcoleaceae]|uniref:hypothetical protein n=1 Tax=Microcoleaceae TaxID=1892252 RepID=UPI001882470E|nr:hypothetical protein [Tychonema sp. LEGE 06208]MBE9163745.1 hypothetical protein [Tychonema sp. LEGE 06208]
MYVPSVLPAEPGEICRSYTPNAEGEAPAVAMELLSDYEEFEYSVKPTYPYGKWQFYERMLQVLVGSISVLLYSAVPDRVFIHN